MHHHAQAFSLGYWWIAIGIFFALAAIAAYDRFVSKDNVLTNFPIVGHFRYWLIDIGPELRQYIVAGNREELPFNREEREWVYRSARGENNYFGFGTDDQIYAVGYPIIKQAAFPHGEVSFTASIHDVVHDIPAAKVLGAEHARKKAWRPRSIVNISAMSFGSLGANAITALNKGAMLAGCYHNTGEGGLSHYHRQGADVIYQIGTGMFGCRTLDGKFSMEKLLETVNAYPHVRGIEIKLSQGAKPGKGGVLPGKKVTPEIAMIRGIEARKDCISPNKHAEFGDVRGLIAFVERIADATGLPVGIKSAIGKDAFWRELAAEMRTSGKGPDWITVDGGEGGTGAAPLTFTDHVSLPFKIGFGRVYRAFLGENMTEHVAFIGSGKLGFPDRAVIAMAMGCDMINIAREAMLSIGCIQAQRCHTDHCPAGIATQNRYLERGVDPDLQATRFARFCQSLRNEILAVTHACGYEHPSQFTTEDVEIGSGPAQFETLREIFGYTPARVWRGIEGWGGGPHGEPAAKLPIAAR